MKTAVDPCVLKLEVFLPVLVFDVTAFNTSVMFCCRTFTQLLLETFTPFEEKAPFPATFTVVFGSEQPQDGSVAVLDEPPTVTFTVLFALPVETTVVPPVLKFALLPPVFADELTTFVTDDELL